MNARHLVLLAASSFLAFSFVVACGSSTKCAKENCGGCCAADGTCQPGVSTTGCGKAGAACATCGPGTSCQAGLCSAGVGGGGGGGSGGGSGGGTGGGSGGGVGGGSGGGVGGGAGGGSGGGAGGGSGGGAGTGLVGAACTGDGQCATNDCVLGFPGGYCSLDCSTSGTGGVCPSGSSCTHVCSAADCCLENCSTPGQGQGQCRSGYVCDKYLAFGTTNGSCFPACPGLACPGGTTCQSGYCCGGSKFKCCTGTQACNNGAACGGDGYCP